MKPLIPELSLSEIVKSVLDNQEKKLDYYLASFSSPMQLSTTPHRASYFGLALCTKGTAHLLASLEDYPLLTGSLIVMGPTIIRTWKDQSTDYAEESLFFTIPLFFETRVNSSPFKEFTFFGNETPNVIQLDIDDANLISKLLQDIKDIIGTPTLRKDEIVKSYINIILNQVADLYDKYCPKSLTEPDTQTKMVNQFKKSLIENYLHIRSVNGYANLLNITPKHLSQTIKANTGKTAREWIHDILILEAKVRLKQTSLSINQISDSLKFSDPSLFGKYFKRYAGFSPAVYRKRKEEIT
ncbi:AraC family transcriptional regulator [Pedobacter sp. PAMC26386]|nr:AraC family transcriptional regulator [Pedobacter sp. PAMC26386]